MPVAQTPTKTRPGYYEQQVPGATPVAFPWFGLVPCGARVPSVLQNGPYLKGGGWGGLELSGPGHFVDGS